jgi:hypothetical protein
MGNTANHLSNEHFQSISICSHILTLQLYGLVFSQLNALPCVAFHPSHSPGRLNDETYDEQLNRALSFLVSSVAFSSRLQRYFSKQTSNERAALHHCIFIISTLAMVHIDLLIPTSCKPWTRSISIKLFTYFHPDFIERMVSNTVRSTLLFAGRMLNKCHPFHLWNVENVETGRKVETGRLGGDWRRKGGR